jgi:large repetitive protein
MSSIRRVWTLAAGAAIAAALAAPALASAATPDTTIDSGPSGPTKSDAPTFTFSSTVSGSTFQCSVDGAGFSPCSSPFTTPTLPDGPHNLAVQAIDPSMNVDPSPATRSFIVDTTAPETTIDDHPRARTRHRTASFSFSSSEAGSSFLCSYNGLPYATCTSPYVTPKLHSGIHRFDVLATDPAGNRDQTAATFIWKVKKGGGGHHRRHRKHHGHHRH